MNLFVLFVILILGTVISTAYLHEQGEKLASKTSNEICVFDFVHNYLPDLSQYYHLYNAFLLVFIAPLVVYHGTFDVLAFMYSLLWLLVPLFIFRCITTCASVPCATTGEYTRDWGSLIKRYIFGGNHDCMPSGHLMFSLSLVLLMLQYEIITNKVLWLGLVGAYGAFSTMSKNHWTIDIIMAVPTVIAFYDFTFCRSAVKDITVGVCSKPYFASQRGAAKKTKLN